VDLKELETFCLVARFGGIFPIAHRLKRTPAAISIKLKKLEKELGVALFEHRPNKLVLTAQGESFLKEAVKVLEAVDRAKKVVGDEALTHIPKLTVAFGSDIAKFFAPKIALFVKKHPHFRVSLLTHQSRDTLSLVEQGRADLGIGRFQKVSRGIKKETLLEHSLALVCPPRHPLARIRKFSLDSIEPYRLITFTRGSATRHSIESVLRQNGVEVRDTFEVSTCHAALDYVLLGLGVGMVHDICLASEFKTKLHRIDMSDIFGKTEVSLIYRPSSLLNPIHKEFVHLLHS
jgi:DNA-binding transcriptional LysR family regulator